MSKTSSYLAKHPVTIEMTDVRSDSGVLTHFVIATSTGYRATLPACDLTHSHTARYSCRGWSRERAGKFMVKVLKSYGSAANPVWLGVPR